MASRIDEGEAATVTQAVSEGVCVCEHAHAHMCSEHDIPTPIANGSQGWWVPLRASRTLKGLAPGLELSTIDSGGCISFNCHSSVPSAQCEHALWMLWEGYQDLLPFQGWQARSRGRWWTWLYLTCDIRSLAVLGLNPGILGATPSDHPYWLTDRFSSNHFIFYSIEEEILGSVRGVCVHISSLEVSQNL